DLEKTRLDFESFQINLYSAHPQLRTQRAEFEPITLSQCASLIPDSKTALMEFLVSEDNTVVFVLTRSEKAGQIGPDLKVYNVAINKKELANLAEGFRGSIARRDVGYQESAKALFGLLIKPAAAQLLGASHLIIVPDDVLWDLPFQALLSGFQRFLGEDYAISYAPSLTALREMLISTRNKPQRANASLSLLALGNPALGKVSDSPAKEALLKDNDWLPREALMDADLVPLPQAERQVQGLGRLYGPAKRGGDIGGGGTEDRLKGEAS